ncbi:tyrosine-type recombinase/integrase [Glaciibacter superstes]|uniref:tyrosine-type recombinase/integrase n=1 Tax=Glaciibacter superstes TaxID=501023 RepID=UPI0003B79B5C|nr:tyrosine-type recombinase/integrase [Glaciibacter superstes]
MQDSGDILAFWARFMQAEDLTDATITERLRFIRHVERATGDLLTLTRHDLISFMGSNETWTNSTKQHYRSALHTFFTWLQDEGVRLDNPAARLPKVKARKRTPNPATVDDIALVLNGGAYARTRRMVALHYYVGLRVHEIAKAHGHDVDWNERTIRVYGKGKKTRVLPLNDAVWEVVKDLPRDGYWFPNWKANKLFALGEGHILSNSVSDVLSRAMRRSGIIGHKPHDLRAATATEQNRAGVSPFVIQQNMRHENMDTTTKYVLVDIEQMRAGFNALPAVPMPGKSNRRRAA